MRWLVFLIFAITAIVLELSFRHVLALRSLGGVSPSFIAPLVVFVALCASRRSALWACLLLGLLLDMLTQLPYGKEIAYVPGPHALGYVFGGYLVLQIRAMVFRGRVLTLALLTLALVVAVSIVVVAIYSIRSWYPDSATIYPTKPSALRAMLRQIGVGIYSALMAIPVGWILLQTLPLWSFATAGQASRVRRGR